MSAINLQGSVTLWAWADVKDSVKVEVRGSSGRPAISELMGRLPQCTGEIVVAYGGKTWVVTGLRRGTNGTVSIKMARKKGVADA